MYTIEDVLHKMDEIVLQCKAKKSRIGYFAILYRQVTKRIKEGIENDEFEDNPRMEKLDILFATRFFEAYELHLTSASPTQSWACAFNTSTASGHMILQHLLLGINAHINLDLGIAAVLTMNGQDMLGIKNDFDKINIILASIVDGVKANLSLVSPVFGFLIQFAKGKDEILLDFSIKLARDGAWKFANEYLIALDQDDCLRLRDLSIAKLGQKIAKPGIILNFIARLISLTEWKSVPDVMDQLEGIARKCAPNNLRSAHSIS
ncbi:hypothetical protein IFO69_02695 [Echinicola sp. CAU 1574]|uniref:Uncharacterized protein n=1 Tax=Echinicola arenosa TaxID=2774144 RepID=A0ABR9AFZ8_9BACT|nr:DUF5995 family protein [Echinicola arenosa]MBD8487648.1 hypothetical protein [Echinicola arenosa]